MNYVNVSLEENFAQRGGIRINLHSYLAEALYALNERRGQVISKLDLAKALWGMTKLHPTNWSRLIDTYMSQLRRQIEPLGGKIEYEKLKGYSLSWEPWHLDVRAAA
jgi:DNA-binding response OmpR family regulator